MELVFRIDALRYGDTRQVVGRPLLILVCGAALAHFAIHVHSNGIGQFRDRMEKLHSIVAIGLRCYQDQNKTNLFGPHWGPSTKYACQAKKIYLGLTIYVPRRARWDTFRSSLKLTLYKITTMRYTMQVNSDKDDGSTYNTDNSTGIYYATQISSCQSIPCNSSKRVFGLWLNRDRDGMDHPCFCGWDETVPISVWFMI
jgi:hypothetical protein